MDRHQDWCVVVSLIGEGQEINEGEAGVSEWVRALQGDFRHWEVHMPSQLLSEGNSLDAALRWHLEQRVKDPDPGLHLSVSIRSFRSDKVSAFVAAVLGEDSAKARIELPNPEKFAIVRTRNLALARSWLRQNRRAGERAGIVASSNALRLKPEGLFVKAKVDVCNWFLNPGDDVRSSNALEDAATEFDATVDISTMVSLTTSKDILVAAAENNGPEHMLIALGYAGWTAGQLEKELSQNAWLNLDIQDDHHVHQLVYTLPILEKFDYAMQLMGLNFANLSHQAGHA
jgi:hypothetical protein